MNAKYSKYKTAVEINRSDDGTIDKVCLDEGIGGGSSLVPTPFIKKDTYQNLNLTTRGSTWLHTFQKDSFFVLNVPEMVVNGNKPNVLLLIDENSKIIVDIGKLGMFMGMPGNSYRQYGAFAKAGQKLWNNTNTVDINFDTWEIDSMEVSCGSGGGEFVNGLKITPITNYDLKYFEMLPMHTYTCDTDVFYSTFFVNEESLSGNGFTLIALLPDKSEFNLGAQVGSYAAPVQDVVPCLLPKGTVIHCINTAPNGSIYVAMSKIEFITSPFVDNGTYKSTVGEHLPNWVILPSQITQLTLTSTSDEILNAFNSNFHTAMTDDRFRNEVLVPLGSIRPSPALLFRRDEYDEVDFVGGLCTCHCVQTIDHVAKKTYWHLYISYPTSKIGEPFETGFLYIKGTASGGAASWKVEKHITHLKDAIIPLPLDLYKCPQNDSEQLKAFFNGDLTPLSQLIVKLRNKEPLGAAFTYMRNSSTHYQNPLLSATEYGIGRGVYHLELQVWRFGQSGTSQPLYYPPRLDTYKIEYTDATETGYGLTGVSLIDVNTYDVNLYLSINTRIYRNTIFQTLTGVTAGEVTCLGHGLLQVTCGSTTGTYHYVTKVNGITVDARGGNINTTSVFTYHVYQGDRVYVTYSGAASVPTAVLYVPATIF